jgi:hypothetical protein
MRWSKSAGVAGIVFDLFQDFLCIFGTVHFQENFANHRLLVRRKIGPDALFGDVPVIINFGAERIIKGKDDRLSLFLRGDFGTESLQVFLKSAFRREGLGWFAGQPARLPSLRRPVR